MLAELQADALRIEIGVQNLFKAVPHVIAKYNYRNKDPEEIIKSKSAALTEIEVNVRSCLQDLQTFDILLKDSLRDMMEVSTAVRTIIKRLHIDEITQIDYSSKTPSDNHEFCANTTLNEEQENKENSTDLLSPLVLICRQREDTVAETPAVKCDRKSRLPLRNRMDFHKENLN